MSKVAERKNHKVNVPAVGNTHEVENILGAAQEEAGFEKLLKFKKGDFFIGEELVPLGTKYIAHVIGWTRCWIKFVDDEVVERKTYRVALGERPPERADLDDLKKDNWPEGIDGNPADPWCFQYLLPLEKVSDGEVVIFTTSSFGGRRAVADLCERFAKRKTKSASYGQPIVKLAKTEMPTKKFGRVPRPHFETSTGMIRRGTLSKRRRPSPRKASSTIRSRFDEALWAAAATAAHNICRTTAAHTQPC